MSLSAINVRYKLQTKGDGCLSLYRVNIFVMTVSTLTGLSLRN
jgi:hypothetical protein